MNCMLLFQILDSIYIMLFDTIEKVCSNHNDMEQINDIQIILSDIFDTIRKVGLIRCVAVTMAIIDLISKLLLSKNIKGIYNKWSSDL